MDCILKGMIKMNIKKIIKALMIIILFSPMIFFFIGSLMGGAYIPTFEAYIELLLDSPEFFVMFWNSWGYIFFITIGQLIVAAPMAWGLTRTKCKINKVILVIYFLVMMMPFQVKMLPEYMVLLKMDLLDTRLGIILPEIFSTLPVWLLFCSFIRIPKGVIESAQMDGANEIQIFLKIALPFAKPGVVTCVILSIIEYWNMVEQPLTFLKNKGLMPLTLFTVQNTENITNILFAMSFLLSVLMLLIIYVLEETFESGLSMMIKSEK